MKIESGREMSRHYWSALRNHQEWDNCNYFVILNLYSLLPKGVLATLSNKGASINYKFIYSVR